MGSCYDLTAVQKYVYPLTISVSSFTLQLHEALRLSLVHRLAEKTSAHHDFPNSTKREGLCSSLS